MANSGRRSVTKSVVVGLLLAAVGQILSLFLAGAGHGWVSPLLASTVLWFAAPAAFAIAWPALGKGRKLMLPMVALALMADAWLVARTLSEWNAFRSYIEVNGAVGLFLVGTWLSLWLAWQAALVRSLVLVMEKR